VYKFNELSKIISEGFLADYIINSEDCSKAVEYAKDMAKGRKVIHTGTASNLKCLHRYNRFLKWIIITYGDQKFKDATQVQNFLTRKLNELLTCTGDWKSFYQWLQKETLCETSKMIYG